MVMMASSSSTIQSVYPRVSGANFHVPLSPHSLVPIYNNSHSFSKLRNSIHLAAAPLPKASAGNGGLTDDGVSLGTMKLPLDNDLQRFASLLFQPLPGSQSAPSYASQGIMLFLRAFHY
ncbi:hypothetical protein JHK85_005043 [Glycine max]|nr:hypothetical protein JHK85_005043 [Glycine max]